MKAESTIRKTLSQLRKEKKSNDEFIELIKGKAKDKTNEYIEEHKRKSANMKGHIDALRWILGE